MKWFDKFLQKERLKKASNFIKPNSIILDIGSDNGILFKTNSNIKFGIGIDPNIKEGYSEKNYSLIKGYFPDSCPDGISFDAITLLAVLEHIPTNQQKDFAQKCFDILNYNGIVIITVPSPKVDQILNVLKKFQIVDGMHLEEHFGFNPEDVKGIFDSKDFRLIHHRKFQFGLNNIYVFQKM